MDSIMIFEDKLTDLSQTLSKVRRICDDNQPVIVYVGNQKSEIRQTNTQIATLETHVGCTLETNFLKNP